MNSGLAEACGSLMRTVNAGLDGYILTLIIWTLIFELTFLKRKPLGSASATELALVLFLKRLRNENDFSFMKPGASLILAWGTRAINSEEVENEKMRSSQFISTIRVSLSQSYSTVIPTIPYYLTRRTASFREQSSCSSHGSQCTFAWAQTRPSHGLPTIVLLQNFIEFKPLIR